MFLSALHYSYLCVAHCPLGNRGHALLFLPLSDVLYRSQEAFKKYSFKQIDLSIFKENDRDAPKFSRIFIPFNLNIPLSIEKSLAKVQKNHTLSEYFKCLKAYSALTPIYAS